MKIRRISATKSGACSRLVVRMVRFYQRNISPLSPPRCRYQPTCSQYMIDCLEKYGVLRGLPRGIWRIIRCNPFVKGGFDPVR